MTRLVVAAATLVAGAGVALVQSDCLPIGACPTKSQPAAQTVAQTAQPKSDCCPSSKAEVVTQQVAQEAKSDCSGSVCPVTGQATQVAQVAQKSDCSGASCETSGAAATQVAQTSSDCASQCSGEGKATQVAQTAAQDGHCSGGSCESGAAAATQVAMTDDCASQYSGESKAAQVALASDMPAIECHVGEKVTRCTTEAGKLSQASGEPIIYAVAGRTYESSGEATKAYAAQLTSYLDTATRIQFVVDGACTPCPDAASKACSEGSATMTYRVAGRDFQCAETAIRAAAMAYAASRQVQMQYVVDGECGPCPDSAKQKAATTGAHVAYRVGDQETGCEVQASVLLAKARIAAATGAVADLQG